MNTLGPVAATLAVLGPAVGLLAAPVWLLALTLPVLLVAVVLAAVLTRPQAQVRVPAAV